MSKKQFPTLTPEEQLALVEEYGYGNKPIRISTSPVVSRGVSSGEDQKRGNDERRRTTSLTPEIQREDTEIHASNPPSPFLKREGTEPDRVKEKLEVDSNSTYASITSPEINEELKKRLTESILESDLTEKEIEAFLGKGLDKYQPMAFEDPVEMLGYFDDNIKAGVIEWHKWQVEVNMFLSKKFTKNSPLRFQLVACNGSGKDAFVNAPFAVWFILCKIRSRCVITSASYTQLKNQTENYIRFLCSLINRKAVEEGLYPEAPFIIKKEHIVCRYTKSEIIMFTTDDPGRAEGYHPFPDYPNGEVCIIINEAKTVDDTIYDALSRCTYTRMILVSSPGQTSGFLYNYYKKSIDWRNTYQSGKWYSRVVNAYECTHISRELIEAEKEELGENHPLFRSKRLALFTSLNEQIVITIEQIDRCVEEPPDKRKVSFYHRRAGLDIAKGGDENALAIIEGNQLIGLESFVASDFEEVTGPVIINLLNKWEIKPEDEINADDGGVGSGLLDYLRARNWRVNRIMNQHIPTIASRGFQFGNRGAQNWFLFATLVQKKLIDLSLLVNNQRARDQLSSRYYKQHETQGKLILESKKEARANGHGSPDRADAIVLAFAGLTMHDFIDAPIVQKKQAVSGVISQSQLVKAMEDLKWKNYKGNSIQNKLNSGFANSSRTPSNVMKFVYGN